MDLKTISKEINKIRNNYEIGNLQDFRVKTKKLSKPKTWDIFPKVPVNENWTFHVGGRTELQFNIGYEEEGLRYGFAFSLQPSINLPDISILFPKIKRLNSIIHTRPYLFENFQMWLWTDNGRTQIQEVKEIEENDIVINNFIFIGKLKQNPSVKEIIETLDFLYPIYKEVETPNIVKNQDKEEKDFVTNKFVFKKNQYKLPEYRMGSTIAKEINIQLRHSIIQQKLYDNLVIQYGEENVGVEQYYGLNRIDVVVQNNNDLYFYEVKTGNTARDCIREALGQLMDYNYYPNIENAKKIFIVGEAPYDEMTKVYINHLKENFKLPIEYIYIKV